MLSAMAVAVQGIGFTPELVAVQGIGNYVRFTRNRPIGFMAFGMAGSRV